jgi:hypothetical protein
MDSKQTLVLFKLWELDACAIFSLRKDNVCCETAYLARFVKSLTE